MKLVIRPDAASVIRLAADTMARQLRLRPDSVLGLATGRTMERVYARLVQLGPTAGLDFSACRSFNLDEYVGLSPTDPRSYRSYMDQHLFGPTGIGPERGAMLHGMEPDHQAEGARYEAAIRAAGGIDLQILGLGETGHIGFNEPLSAFASRTRDVTLAPRTRRQNAAMFGGHEDQVPLRAMTMGIATILDARRILLIVTGVSKSAILAQTIEGPLTAAISGTALHLHADVLVIADEDAASGLAQRDYYDWLARHDPELAAYATAEADPN